VLWLTIASIPSYAAPPERPVPRQEQVVFVCEHGNVKSVMAASYFNAAAKELGLSVHAVSRGVVPDSTSVPVAIAEGLRRDGIDVSTFVPIRAAESDVRSSARVVLIGTDMPADVPVDGTPTEHWNDVPPASVDFAGARKSLRVHVRELILELERGTPKPVAEQREPDGGERAALPRMPTSRGDH
jgi:arsenate reductase (thioredoxin)